MSVFQNYETAKLQVENPEAVNLILLLALVALVGSTVRRVPKEAWFDRRKTDSLKGVVILLIVLTHFWTHVTDEKVRFLLAGDAVGLFLMLSGFGLTMSQMRSHGPERFALRRVRRVMLPYWISTVFILTLDLILLNRVLPLRQTLSTFLGINLSHTVRRLDYVRWFVTFLLLQ
jgi:peptidoglycan/LPS O-acetylase OafA/YrhL